MLKQARSNVLFLNVIQFIMYFQYAAYILLIRNKIYTKRGSAKPLGRNGSRGPAFAEAAQPKGGLIRERVLD